MNKFKPMLGVKCGDLANLTWPLICSVKLDGIRCITTPEGPRTRSLKPVPNRYIEKILASLPIGLDGELVLCNPDGSVNFRETTSAVMSRSGEPNFTFMVFDYLRLPKLSFATRLSFLADEHPRIYSHPNVTVLSQKLITNPIDALTMFQDARVLGHEGLILRSPTAPYKFGRATLREQGMLKMKPWEDAEAVVVAITEEMFNANEATTSETGHTKRSSHQANKIPKGRMGTLVVRNSTWPKDFEIGTGFTAAERQMLWDNPPIGRTVKFSYLAVGDYDVPRHAVYQGFRANEDMSDD